jgi:Zn-dependent M32 family carboxypeptidase
MFEKFGELHEERVETNRTKVLSFLENRINRVLELVEAKQYNKLKQFVTTNHDSKDKRKTVSVEVMENLKKYIPELFLN